MITEQYSWQWAANAPKEEFLSHFVKNGDSLMNQLSSECEKDNENSLKPLVEAVLSQISNLPFDKPQDCKAIRRFFKKVIDWEGDYHWHIHTLFSLYFRAIAANQEKLVKATSILMHSNLANLAKDFSPVECPAQTKEEKLLLHYSANGELEQVKKSMEKGVDINTCDALGFTPLQIACIKGHETLVSYLLNFKNLKLEQANLQGDTALTLAVNFQHEAICSKLLVYGASYTGLNMQGDSALLCACRTGNLAIVKMLAASGASLHEKNKVDVNGLFIATFYGYNDIANFLLENQVTPCTVHKISQNTPFMKAYELNNILLVQSLIAHGALTDMSPHDREIYLGASLHDGHLFLFKELLKPYQNNPQFLHEWLFHSCIEGRADFVGYLKEVGANIDDNFNGQSFLIHFCKKGDEEPVRCLLKYGANINCQTTVTKETPLMVAARAGHEKIVELLVEHKALLDVTDLGGRTALMHALMNSNVKGCLEIALYLIDVGANLNIFDQFNDSALGFALFYKCPSIVKKLIENGADIQQLISKKKLSPFDHLYSGTKNVKNRTEIALYLISTLDSKILFATDNTKWTPLHFTCFHGDIEVSKKLLEIGAEVNAKTKNNSHPFMLACLSGNEGLIQLLLQYRPEISLELKDDWLFSTPPSVHEAIFSYIKEPFLELIPEELRSQIKNCSSYHALKMFFCREASITFGVQFSGFFPNKKYIEELRNRFKPDDYLEVILTNKIFDNHFFEVDPLHFNRALPEDEIGEGAVDWDLKKLTAMFDAINFNDPEGIAYCNPAKLNNQGDPATIEDLKMGLEILLTRIEEKTYLTGTPEKDSEDLIKYYADLSQVIKQIGFKIEQMDKDEQTSALLDICTLGLHCGNTVVEAYRMKSLLYGKLPTQFKDLLYRELQLQRENILIHWSSQITHAFSHYMYLLGAELNLPNAKADLFSKPDPLAEIQLTKEEAKTKFFKQYCPGYLVELAKSSLWSYYRTNRDEAIEFFKTFVPPFWKKEEFSELYTLVKDLNRQEAQKKCLELGFILESTIVDIKEALESLRRRDYFATGVLELDQNDCPTGIKFAAVRYILLSLNVIKL